MNTSLNRRSFLVSVAAVAAAPVALAQSTSTTPAKAPPAAAPATDGPFTLPALPYAPEALDASIDAETMRIHHSKHHQAYVTKLNDAVKGMIASGTPVPNDVDALIAKLETLPADKATAIKNNGGGHSNHSLLWTVLAPKGRNGDPSKELVVAVERDLGSVDKLKEAMQTSGAARFGSGWAWLVVTRDKKLVVASTPNQESPLMGGGTGAGLSEKSAVSGTPIYGIDVWEHAYYLRYQNRRPDYLKAIWDVTNWTEVSRRFAAAMG